MHTKAIVALMTTALFLTACTDDFVPRDKTATYDSATGTLDLPYPCPDWSHSSLINYDNSLHSNFGCAVNTDSAQQLANPEDIAHGRASENSASPDSEISEGVIEQYRAGKIPQPLQPIQGSNGSSGQ